MRKITLVNQVCGPLFIDVANTFTRLGFKTTLHTGSIEPTYTELDEQVIIKKGISYERKNSFLRLLTWLFFFVQTFFGLLFDNKKNPLFLVSNPPFAPFLGILNYFFFGRTYYILIYDVYPNALVEFNFLSKSSLIVQLWSKLNSLLFLKAEKVFTISEGMKREIQMYQPKTDAVVVHSWVNSDFIQPIQKSENWFANKYKLVEKTVIMYSGNLGVTHDIETIIETAKELRRYSNIHFLIVGEGAKKNKIQFLVDKYDLKNVELLPFQSPATIPFSMSSGDIAIVTLAEGAGTLSVPSKTYYMMAAGMGIIALAEPHSEVSNLVQTLDIGVCSSPKEPVKLAKSILNLINDSEKLANYRRNALAASKLFTPKNAEIIVKHCY